MGLGPPRKRTVFSMWELCLFQKPEHAIDSLLIAKVFEADFLS